MNKEETMYFNMFVQVQRQLDNSPDKWTTIPAITRYKNELDDNIIAIRTKDLKASGSSKGTTVTKQELKNQLSLKVAILCGAMYAYASEQGDEKLISEVGYTTSSLYKLPDTEYAQTVKTLVEKATALLESLTDQGVTADQLTEISTSLDDFHDLIGMPRTLTIQTNTAGVELEQLIQMTKDLMRDKLDKAMLRYKLMDTAFYEGYERARVLID